MQKRINPRPKKITNKPLFNATAANWSSDFVFCPPDNPPPRLYVLSFTGTIIATTCQQAKDPEGILASLDFSFEKQTFIRFYETHREAFEEVKNTYIEAIDTLLQNVNIGEVTKIEGRVKNRAECINKFKRKYQSKLETDEQPYEIKDHLSDLIGIRIVCLYEDQINRVADIISRYFKVIDVTDKISAIEKTEDLFGYKGLHMDLEPDMEKAFFEQYPILGNRRVEVQIRSLMQDTWSILDHKIKYKKSIPNDLKRRINVLSALFELADREFREIRDATAKLLTQEKTVPLSEHVAEEHRSSLESSTSSSGKPINAFNFLRIAGHFFNDFEFEDYKVDNFVQDILKLDHNFSKSAFHKSLVMYLKQIKDYRRDFMADNPQSSFSPYTSIRHCLYLYDKKTFGRILSREPRIRFDSWLNNIRNSQIPRPGTTP